MFWPECLPYHLVLNRPISQRPLRTPILTTCMIRPLTAVRAVMDFRYLAQMPPFDEHALHQLDAALQLFHDHKDSIITIGTHSEHFHIPKLELLQHVVPSI
jgi:hypothetical protein